MGPEDFMEWDPETLTAILVGLLTALEWEIPKLPDNIAGSVRVIRSGKPSIYSKHLSRDLSRKLAPIANSLLKRWAVLDIDLIDMMEEENSQLRTRAKEADSKLADMKRNWERITIDLNRFRTSVSKDLEVIKNHKDEINVAEGKARSLGYAKGWEEGSERMLEVCKEAYKYV